jgi:hypothetical protein
MAFLVVLESMTPAGRAAFILHDVFGYPFAEVAGIAGRTPAACRQLASSPPPPRPCGAVPRVPGRPAGRPRPGLQKGVGSQGHHRPHRPAGSRRHGHRRHRRPRQLDRPGPGRRQRAGRAACAEVASTAPNLTILARTVNGQPGLVAPQDGVTVAVFAFEVAGDRIRHIWAVRNSENSGPGRQADRVSQPDT